MARQDGLAERRYEHHVRGVRKPDFETLLRICDVLDVTPNDLVLGEEGLAPDDQDHWLSGLNATARRLQLDDLRPAVRQIEALYEDRTAA